MIRGSCHCGSIHWEFDGVPDSATACNCTACRRIGALWAYDWDNEGIRIRAVPGLLAGYVRQNGELAFHFCKSCGNITHWRGLTPDKDGLSPPLKKGAGGISLRTPGAASMLSGDD